VVGLPVVEDPVEPVLLAGAEVLLADEAEPVVEPLPVAEATAVALRSWN